MSKLARALALVAMLAAVQLAAMATVAQAHATDRQAVTAWRARLAASQQPQPTGDAALRRVLARERFSVPAERPPSRPTPRCRRPSPAGTALPCGSWPPGSPWWSPGSPCWSAGAPTGPNGPGTPPDLI